jgi:preprotein translocase subunit YajC
VSNLSGLLPIVIVIVAFYFLFIKPSKARRKLLTDMQGSLVPGVRVMTTSGIFGVVSTVTDEIVRIEIAPGVIIEVVPAAIGRVIVPESAEASAPHEEIQEGEL